MRRAAGQHVTGNVVFGDVVQISGVAGNVTISAARPPYQVNPAALTPVPLSPARARAQPSRLLLARHQVVPFTGRDHTLAGLAGWIGDPEPVAVRLVHATGGQGKTRLATELAIRWTRSGWTVWQFTQTAGAIPGAESRVDLSGGRVLAVVDYADRWPMSALLTLVDHLHRMHLETGATVRILLLARSAGHWWSAVADQADSRLNIAVDETGLPSLAADSDDNRATLFTTAADRFAEFLRGEQERVRGWPVPALGGDDFGQVLAVHMAALAAVDAHCRGSAPPTGPAAISAYLLGREQAQWQHLFARAEAPIATAPIVMQRAAYLATLTGTLPRSAAREVLLGSAIVADTPAADRTIDDHRGCYPPADSRTVLEPVHPDRLGEDLIALSTPGRRQDDVATLVDDWTLGAPTALLTTTTDRPPAWTPAVITVLIETARRWPHVATDVLYPLLRRHPHLAITAGGAALTRLATIPGVDVGVLEALEPLLPDRHTDLDAAAAAISTLLVSHRESSTTDVVDRARMLAAHASRLNNAGRHEEAFQAAHEATFWYRLCVERGADSLALPLALSLSDLSALLGTLGRPEEAVEAAEEAVGRYRQPADTTDEARLAAFALSLSNLAAARSSLGHREQALGAIEEAVGINRHLAEPGGATHLSLLAAALSNRGSLLMELGRPDEALASDREALGLFRGLAAASPETYLPDLAKSLCNSSINLTRTGDFAAGSVTAQEAVTVSRQLVEAGPGAYATGLGFSLLAYASACAGAKADLQAGLLAITEAIEVYEPMAARQPLPFAELLSAARTVEADLLEAGTPIVHPDRRP